MQCSYAWPEQKPEQKPGQAMILPVFKETLCADISRKYETVRAAANAGAFETVGASENTGFHGLSRAKKNCGTPPSYDGRCGTEFSRDSRN